jgi:hypothetical protein
MLSPQVLLKLVVSRVLPQPVVIDGPESEGYMRGSRYREAAVLSYVRKSHLLADEGSYFVTNNSQSGLATSLLGTSFSQTTLSPFLIATNLDSPGGKRAYLDYITLVTTAAGAMTGATLTYLAFALSTDASVGRYSSGGTLLTPLSPNSDISSAKSVLQIYAGALTLNAATANARIQVGQRTLRPCASTSAADVIGEEKILNWGGVEQGMFATYATLTAINSSVHGLPPIVIGPQQCLILHLWSPGGALTTGASYAPEMGWFER